MKKKVIKNSLILICLVILVAVPIFFNFNSSGSFRNFGFRIDQLTIKADIANDGSAKFVERREMTFTSNTKEIFYDFSYIKKAYKANSDDSTSFNINSLVVRVYDETNNTLLDSSYTSNNGNYMTSSSLADGKDFEGKTIACYDFSGFCNAIYVYAKNGFNYKTTIEYEYIVEHIATSYADTSEFTWLFVEDSGTRIYGLDVTINLPNEVSDPNQYQAFVYGSYQGTLSKPEAKTFHLKSDGLAKGTDSLGVRLLLPTYMFTNLKAESINPINVKDEMVRKEQFSYSKFQQSIVIEKVNLYVLAAFIGLVVLFGSWLFIRNKNNQKDINATKNLVFPPAILGFLAKENIANKNDIISTILDLIDRKVIAVKNDSEQIILILNHEKVDYDYEKSLLQFLFYTVGNNQQINLSNLEIYVSNIENDSIYYTFKKDFFAKIKSEVENYQDINEEKVIYQKKFLWTIILGGAICAYFIFVSIFYSQIYTGFYALFTLITVFCVYRILVNLTKVSKSMRLRKQVFLKQLDEHKIDEYTIAYLIASAKNKIKAKEYAKDDTLAVQLINIIV